MNAEHVATVPRRLDLLEAGAAAVTGLTAQQGIDEHLSVAAGETVLIFGASGAVGTLAVQFAKRRRARVIGTARGADATALVRDLGADGVFDARSDEGIERLRELAPEGLDAALALAGGPALERAVEEAGLRVPIGGEYPLEQAAAAHARVERAHVLGRIVLRTREEA